MRRAAIAGVVVAIVFVLLAVAVRYRTLQKEAAPTAASSTAKSPSPAINPATAPAAAPAEAPGFLYGRITAVGGVTYEGRLRWGGSQEAFWGDYFNGAKDENTWATQIPPERLPKESNPLEIFGLEIVQRERPLELGRLFMARFGDITRIEPQGADVRVTLKSGTVFVLARLEASDFDDGVRVWDERGVVDLDSLQILTIELLPTARLSAVPERLHGTVRTPHGDFTGFVQWNRQQCVGTDEFIGRAGLGELRQRFDTIRSIARRSGDSLLVTLVDGRELALSGSSEGRYGTLGMYVDDRRYGRVLVSWDAFERLDFSPGDSGPAYGDFPPGSPLSGSVTTRAGRRLIGRLVFDLDESETTETLDAPFQGVDYTIPFGLVASIVAPSGEERTMVTLHSGEELQLERRGDLGEGNAGLLIFIDGGKAPEYLPWPDVEQIVFERPAAMYPPLGGR